MSELPDFKAANDKAWAEPERAKPNGLDSDQHLQPINPATLADRPLPERQWLVSDWIPMARVTALYGAGGEGKTLLAQMLATACALGKSWLNVPVRKCRSLLLFAEDDLDEMHIRQEAINRLHSCGFADLEAMRWLPMLGEDCELMQFEGGARPLRAPMFENLLRATEEQRAELIVLDTLSDVYCGNENDRALVRWFGRQVLGRLANLTDAAVFVPAHPSLTGINSRTGDSASTGWKATFRSQLYLTGRKPGDGDNGKPGENDLRTLTRTKANWARCGESIELRWQNGVFIPAHATGILASIERRTAERVFLDLLDKVTAEERHVSDSNRAHNYAPKLFSQRPDREGFTKSDFERAMQRLFADHEIRPGTYRGANRHEHECIVRAQN